MPSPPNGAKTNSKFKPKMKQIRALLRDGGWQQMWVGLDSQTNEHTVLKTDEDIMKYFGADVRTPPKPTVRKKKRASAQTQSSTHVLTPLKKAGVVRPGTSKSKQRSCKVCRRKKCATHFCSGCSVKATICGPECFLKHLALRKLQLWNPTADRHMNLQALTDGSSSKCNTQ